MEFNLAKQAQKELIKKLIIEYIYKNEIDILTHDISFIKSTINSHINNLKLIDKDYEKIIDEITNKLSIDKTFSHLDDAQQIINILSNISTNYSLEYCKDSKEISIYFKLKTNQSYLINYDSTNNNWYLALIDSISLELIEEIYSNKYQYFIKFIKEKVAK